MDFEKSKQISNLLGSISISDLPIVPYSTPVASDKYLAFKDDGNIKAVEAIDFYNFLLSRVFLFLAKKPTSDEGALYDLAGLKDVLTEFDDWNKTNTTQNPCLSFGRFLNTKYSDWVDEPNGNAISDYFLSNFQYFYFDSWETSAAKTLLLRFSEDTQTPQQLNVTMWDSRLTDDTVSVDVGLMGFTIPETSTNTSTFVTRNYAKIADGDTTKETDSKWSSVSGKLENNPGGNTSLDGSIVERSAMGDIDATLSAMEDCLTYYENSIDIESLQFGGQVIITTSNELQLSANLDYELFKDRFIYSDVGEFRTGGNNTETIPDVISHSHGVNHMVHNVSVMGTRIGGSRRVCGVEYRKKENTR